MKTLVNLALDLLIFSVKGAKNVFLNSSIHISIFEQTRHQHERTLESDIRSVNYSVIPILIKEYTKCTKILLYLNIDTLNLEIINSLE